MQPFDAIAAAPQLSVANEIQTQARMSVDRRMFKTLLFPRESLKNASMLLNNTMSCYPQLSKARYARLPFFGTEVNVLVATM